MYDSIERYWVSVADSDHWRQFAKWGPAATLFRSQTYRKLQTARRYLTTYHASRKHPSLFQGVNSFCLLIGHAKSGGTLIGSLLDAHANIIFADEADALRYVSAGFSRDQIYHILLKGSRREAMKGRVTARRLVPYSFLVPGQWQGRYEKLQIIGDSKAGPSTRRFAQEPDLLRRLHDVMNGVQVKLLHVIRNPYDPISAMMVRGKRTFENAIEHYFAYCKTLEQLRHQLNDSNLLTVKYEEFVRQPAASLLNICHYIGTDASDDYVNACTSILHKSPDQSRYLVPWDSKWIGVVQQKIDQFDFLAGYSFESKCAANDCSNGV